MRYQVGYVPADLTVTTGQRFYRNPLFENQLDRSSIQLVRNHDVRVNRREPPSNGMRLVLIQRKDRYRKRLFDFELLYRLRSGFETLPTWVRSPDLVFESVKLVV